ncbi:2-oxo-4-hydroxy-4-carboxy-5-ureidoimidazoline decarboxylase [Agromyces hippuratus]|uniref:2-oxo-4-hydroxy-4-carboxy-5-ureidoimidazoline decarboxylase n=1 Tax=Agromyces hippuratus TaxID=286438 RepID=A0A852X3Z7_9MICO|nr:2-oxo-4-hydroxy-4-carboxy-5-ureidoimidazoline decarboxylase [Agromyces hippuratus]NYG20725.1 2-oxo-4-hydroxy-4-carboxy-5-ureidoimidazoline decarboxylase [Agromyces hippuratus]
MKLEDFNGLDRRTAIEALRPCLDIPRWGEELADGRPYVSVAELASAADRAAAPFTAEEIDGALAHHPPIGRRADGATVEASLSRGEQSGVDPNDSAVAAALASGNLAYEARFGRVFLIRAAGRSASEMLALLDERLTNSAADEDVIVAEQLREIAVLRVKGLITA